MEKDWDDEGDSISIMATFEEIVKEANYLPITFKSIELLRQIQINRDLVNTLTKYQSLVVGNYINRKVWDVILDLSAPKLQYS